MRNIGTLASESKARQFSDLLWVEGLEHEVERGSSGDFLIWIASEDDVERGAELLAKFKETPDAFDHRENARRAEELRRAEKKDVRRSRRQVVDARTIFNRLEVPTFGPLTVSLIAACVAVGFASNLGGNIEVVRLFTIADPITWKASTGLVQIREGQVWRLLTPAIIHFGVLHILFNMIWLWDLGNLIEKKHGILNLGAMVLVMSLSSNLAQYVASGPMFGGMSGVVYGLLGYLWMRGHFDPRTDYRLRQDIVVWMGIWYFLCLFGVIPHVANMAHTAGLLIGVGWGFGVSGHWRRLLR